MPKSQLLLYYYHEMMVLLILLMMKVLFSFLLKLNSHHPYKFVSPFQQTLKQNCRASRNFHSFKNMLKLLNKKLF